MGLAFYGKRVQYKYLHIFLSSCEQKAVSGVKYSPVVSPDGIENSQLPATRDNNCVLFKLPRPMLYL